MNILSKEKLTRLSVFFTLTLLFPLYGTAQLRFDPAMISDDKDAVADLSHFEKSGSQLPGVYAVDIYLNGSKLFSKDVNFIAVRGLTVNPLGIKDNTGLMACLSKNELMKMGVNLSINKKMLRNEDNKCLSPGDYIDSAYTKFDFPKMRLDINIPQAFLTGRRDPFITASSWDNGINAALMTWQYSGNTNSGTGGKSINQYLNLTSGVNVGSWRLRYNSVWTSYSSRRERRQSWEQLNTYLMRPLTSLRSRLTIGNSQSGGSIFEPVSFNGIQLATDTSMYPDKMQGFAPVIRGVASSNAEVYVYQNGNLIYRTAVPAGAFVINDLYSVSNSGDLRVTVRGADGSENHFVVPFSTVPVLQREGRIVYSLAAGRIRDFNSNHDQFPFTHGTILWGLTDNTTVYGGTQLANRYKAAAIGAGVNIGGLGAISVDVTRADSILSDHSKHQGESWRLLYARSMLSTGTSVQILANRFSTRGYYSLSDVALNNMSGWKSEKGALSGTDEVQEVNWSNYYNLYRSKKNLFQVSLSQKIKDFGSLYTTASHQTYWGNAAPATSIQAGFSSIIGNISYQISMGYSKYGDQPNADKNIYFSFSVPLESLFSSNKDLNILHNTTMTYSLNQNSKKGINQMQLNGTALESDNLSWGVSQGFDLHGNHLGDTSADYQGTYGGISLGYGQSNDYSQLRYGTTGSAVLSEFGLTFGQQLGSTNVLVAAPGASYIPVENSPGTRTDWRGYTIKNFASAYRKNRIALDISRLDRTTDIINPVKDIVPTEGALVLAQFHVRKGHQAIMTLYHNGKTLPFGTLVSVLGDSKAGIVDENGEVYLSGLDEKGEIIATWGNKTDASCKAFYDFSGKNSWNAVFRRQLICK